MELRQLRYFVTVAEELHFGRAAERLHIVQPAVSQQVRRLERELGVELFDRSPRHVRLTAAGERLLTEARTALSATDRMMAMAGTWNDCGGELRIGSSPELSTQLQPGLGKLRKLVPELTVRVTGGALSEQVAALRAGQLDLLIVRGTGEWDGTESFPLWEEPVAVALPSLHSLANAPTLRWEQLAELPLRLPDHPENAALVAWVTACCRDAGFEPARGRPIVRMHDALVEIGNGEAAWTVLSGSVGHGEQIGCVAVRPLETRNRVPIRMLVPGTRPSGCVRALAEAFASSPEGLPDGSVSPEDNGFERGASASAEV